METKTKIMIVAFVVLAAIIGVLAYLYHTKGCPPMIACPECEKCQTSPLGYLWTRANASNYDNGRLKLNDPSIKIFSQPDGPNAMIVATQPVSGKQSFTTFPYLIKSIAVNETRLYTISETLDLRAYSFDSDTKYTLLKKITTGCNIVCLVKDIVYVLKAAGVSAYNKDSFDEVSLPALPSIITNMYTQLQTLWITDGTKFWSLDTSKNEWTEYLFTSQLLGTDMSLM